MYDTSNTLYIQYCIHKLSPMERKGKNLVMAMLATLKRNNQKQPSCKKLAVKDLISTFGVILIISFECNRL